MVPTKSEEAAAAELIAAAVAAKKDLLAAADTARERIRDTCEDALRDLSRTTEDRRQLNGSYRWGSSKENLEKRTGKLEVGQAKREEQIIGLISDVDLIGKSMSELSSRMTTLRELIVEVKDACTIRIDSLKDDTRKDKIKTQQYVIGIVVGFIVTIAAATLIAFVHLK